MDDIHSNQKNCILTASITSALRDVDPMVIVPFYNGTINLYKLILIFFKPGEILKHVFFCIKILIFKIGYRQKMYIKFEELIMLKGLSLLSIASSTLIHYITLSDLEISIQRYDLALNWFGCMRSFVVFESRFEAIRPRRCLWRIEHLVPTSTQKNQFGECTIFNVNNCVVVLTFLFSFLLLQRFFDWLISLTVR